MSLEGWRTLRAVPRVDGGRSTDGAQADRDWQPLPICQFLERYSLSLTLVMKCQGKMTWHH